MPDHPVLNANGNFLLFGRNASGSVRKTPKDPEFLDAVVASAVGKPITFPAQVAGLVRLGGLCNQFTFTNSTGVTVDFGPNGGPITIPNGSPPVTINALAEEITIGGAGSVDITASLVDQQD